MEDMEFTMHPNESLAVFFEECHLRILTYQQDRLHISLATSSDFDDVLIEIDLRDGSLVEITSPLDKVPLEHCIKSWAKSLERRGLRPQKGWES